MKERFYAGISLQKDLELVNFIKELEKNPSVIVLEKPQELLVHECACQSTGCRYDTGKTHIGYESHYVTFYYRGYVISVNAGTWYPFLDENYPGPYNFVVYKRTDGFHERQLTYNIAYDGLHSVDRWISNGARCERNLDSTEARRASPFVPFDTIRDVRRIVHRLGAFREKSIMATAPLFIPSSTWNSDHKVVHVISPEEDKDGHHNGFDVDIVTGKICG